VTPAGQAALRLGCSAIGFTIYPGSSNRNEQYESVRAMLSEARDAGLPTILWAYPRGGKLSKKGETAVDVVAYAYRVDLDRTVESVLAARPDLVGLGIAFQNNIDDYVLLVRALRERGFSGHLTCGGHVGTFCWDELHTKDTEAAKKFYASVFGWSGNFGKGESAGHGENAYWHWTNAGKEIGGMTSHMGGPNTPPHWLAYIAAGDAYQVNLTAPFTAPLFAPASALSERMREAQGGADCASVDTGDPRLLIAPPVRVFRRPGTARRLGPSAMRRRRSHR
jgi:predicted enzyme related to lactoylglutathione lyase